MAKRNVLKPKPPRTSHKSETMVFQESCAVPTTAARTVTKKQKEAFLAASTSAVTGAAEQRRQVQQRETDTRSAEEVKQDIEDDKLDQEVVKLLNSKGMVDLFVAGQLTGKERRRHREGILDAKLGIKKKHSKSKSKGTPKLNE